MNLHTHDVMRVSIKKNFDGEKKFTLNTIPYYIYRLYWPIYKLKHSHDLEKRYLGRIPHEVMWPQAFMITT